MTAVSFQKVAEVLRSTGSLEPLTRVVQPRARLVEQGTRAQGTRGPCKPKAAGWQAGGPIQDVDCGCLVGRPATTALCAAGNGSHGDF